MEKEGEGVGELLSPFCDVFCRHRRSKLRKAAPKRSDFDLRRLWQTAALAKANGETWEGEGEHPLSSALPPCTILFLCCNSQLAAATSALAVQATFVLGMSFARFVHLNRHIARTAVQHTPPPSLPFTTPCCYAPAVAAR